MSRYRSYHGGTNATLAVTGDQRRWGAEPMKMPGVVHFFDPYPYSFSFGEDDEAITKNKCVLAAWLASLHILYLLQCGHNKGSFSFAPAFGCAVPLLCISVVVYWGCLTFSRE